jgi:hypothetical protein
MHEYKRKTYLQSLEALPNSTCITLEKGIQTEEIGRNISSIFYQSIKLLLFIWQTHIELNKLITKKLVHCRYIATLKHIDKNSYTTGILLQVQWYDKNSPAALVVKHFESHIEI